MKKLAFGSVLVLASAMAMATAQEGGTSGEMDKALAAGWKAAFTCSASFNGGLPLETIERNELDGIYPDFEEAYATLPAARINRERKIVSVQWSDTLPARYAVWREGFGCTQMPLGAELGLMEYLPSFGRWTQNTEPDTSTAIGTDVRLTPDDGFYGAMEIPLSFAFDGATYGAGTRTSAVVVVSGGEVIAEKYARGISADTPQRTWSVAKSFSATVIGAASYAGLFDYKGRTSIDAWETPGDPRQKITTVNLLQMASGLDSGARGNRTDQLYFGGGTVVDNAVGKSLEFEPGKRFKYANNDTVLAMRALRERIGDDSVYHALPYEKLLWKIGATHTVMEIDWRGDFLSSSMVWTTARDMARLGQLYLQDGVWGKERILPEGWVEFVSSPAPVQPSSRRGFGYGAQFWLLNNSEGVPADTFAGLGNRGQHLIIIPSRDIVIVRRGYDVNGGTPFDIAAFTKDMLAAIDAADKARRQAEQLATAVENGNLVDAQ